MAEDELHSKAMMEKSLYLDSLGFIEKLYNIGLKTNELKRVEAIMAANMPHLTVARRIDC